ncbi:MAG: Hsp33 family molecular chaperone HslO [Oscillospiraceae bacterium]|jgi:molecular chaperone Hsp33|nr:Hsp33 family molecular chaperone HslO [Oscillospiraceae bacterium]
MKETGKLIRCITDDGLILGAAIDSTAIVRRMKEIHGTSPAVTIALGQLLTGASLMGNKLKEKGASLTLRVEGGGGAGMLLAVSDSEGNVRGLAGHPQFVNDGEFSVSDAVGTDGLMAVIKDFGEGTPYTAQVKVTTGSIAQELTNYHAVSEQVPTVLSLGVKLDENGEVVSAGGYIIQLLPLADEREIERIESTLATVKSVSAMFAAGFTLEDMCKAALDGFTLEFFEETEVSYKCYCSREKCISAFKTLSEDDLLELSREEKPAEVCCQFCDAKRYFSREELLAIAAEIRSDKEEGRTAL